MGFFRGSPKSTPEEDSQIIVDEQDEFPALPGHAGTVIAPGITVTGEVRGSGAVHIEGTVEGKIRLNGSLTVAPGGLVKGPIMADVVSIAGRVEGSASAYERVQLARTGTVVGDVTSYSVVIEDGGQLNGRCTMTGVRQEPGEPRGDASSEDDCQSG